jgi:hypothetical protein
MTITLKIDNPDIEQQLKEFIKEQKELTLEAFNNFINSFQKQEKLIYKKRDPRKYSRIIKREYDSKDVDDVALLHIEDSAKYVHDLRREKRCN